MYANFIIFSIGYKHNNQLTKKIYFPKKNSQSYFQFLLIYFYSIWFFVRFISISELQMIRQ